MAAKKNEKKPAMVVYLDTQISEDAMVDLFTRVLPLLPPDLVESLKASAEITAIESGLRTQYKIEYGDSFIEFLVRYIPLIMKYIEFFKSLEKDFEGLGEVMEKMSEDYSFSVRSDTNPNTGEPTNLTKLSQKGSLFGKILVKKAKIHLHK